MCHLPARGCGFLRFLQALDHVPPLHLPRVHSGVPSSSRNGNACAFHASVTAVATPVTPSLEGVWRWWGCRKAGGGRHGEGAMMGGGRPAVVEGIGGGGGGGGGGERGGGGGRGGGEGGEGGGGGVGGGGGGVRTKWGGPKTWAR